MNYLAIALTAAVVLSAGGAIVSVWFALNAANIKREILAIPVPERVVTRYGAEKETNAPADLQDEDVNWQVTGPPMVNGETLYHYLVHTHPLGDNVWAAIVAEFYNRAAAVPAIKSYFWRVLERPEGMERLQFHFTQALIIVTKSGLSQRVLDMLEDKHKDVRDKDERRITPEIYDLAIDTLVGILREQQVPAKAIEQLALSIGPAKNAIVGKRHIQE